MKGKNIRIGTRESELAIKQAEKVKEAILHHYPEIEAKQIQIIKIKTSGDKFLNQNLSEIGGKGLFTKEIEEALLNKEIDLAVHSVKDMPAKSPEGIVIAGMLKRDDASDVLISAKYKNLNSMPSSAVIGTSSLRRKAALKLYRPDLQIIGFRGNINTRLKKMLESDIDGIILAASGLQRINRTEMISEILPYKIMLPAVGQGAIGIECRIDDTDALTISEKINCSLTKMAVSLERIFMEGIDGSCKTPIACFVTIEFGRAWIRSQIFHPEGIDFYSCDKLVSLEDAREAMLNIVSETKENAADILEFIRSRR